MHNKAIIFKNNYLSGKLKSEEVNFLEAFKAPAFQVQARYRP